MAETSHPAAELPAQPVSRALRAVVIRAIDEAQKRNAPLVEAEHLLLALSADGAVPVRSALMEAGLDHEGIVALLAAERAASLHVVGVTPPSEDRLAAAPRVTRPRWGASAKEALVRAHRVTVANRRQRAAEVDLLAALFGLELGTVPRALALAGVDRNAILTRALRAA